ncbi:hypothetical protein ACOCEA_07250 [Maribacter sp. CXY002]|uniref:hypothetical protein n=1 Tax=Maribacter luteocoastalis TaxID=3407671 RepID=UPI003B677EC1
MNTSGNLFDTKMISDILLIVMLVVTTLLFFQYYHVIEEEITQVVLNSMTDINNSIAETRTGR